MLSEVWRGLDERTIQRMLDFAFIVRTAHFMPLTEDSNIANHLRQGSRVTFNGLTSRGAPEPAFAELVKLRIPSLNHLSIPDLIRLRNNEEIFFGVQSCLHELAQQVGQLPTEGSYASLEQDVRELAGDIVTPVYNQLESMRKKASVKDFLWGASVRGVLTLGIGAGAGAFGLPAPGKYAVANKASHLATRKLRQAKEELAIGASVLLSLTDQDPEY
jgi:hypothetical protein